MGEVCVLPPLKVRIITYGNSKVGKSCLIKRYCEKRFVTRYHPTVGVDYGAIKVTVQGRNVRVNVFDTSGHPAYKEVVNEFYEGNHGILLVFDVTSEKTFAALGQWLEDIKSHQKSKDDGSASIIMVVGNRAGDDEEEEEREVSREEAQLWSHQRGLYYCETSARSGFGVKECFQSLLLRVVKAQQPPTASPEQQRAMQQLYNAKDEFGKLGLPPSASEDDILKAYKKLAILLHPDKNPVNDAEEAFKYLGRVKASLLE